MDAVTEVEKLQHAAQQLTTTIIPSSMVNMMSSEEDWCFQCQERHIAPHCPHIICHEWDQNSDTSSWTALMEYPLQGHWHHTTRHTEIPTTDLALGTTGKTEKEETGPDLSLDTANIIAPAIHDLHRGCSQSQQWDRHSCHRSSSRWSHSAHWGHSCRSCHDTPHQSHQQILKHTAAHQATTLRIAVDHTHNHPTNQSKYSSHQKGSHSSGSYSNQGNWKSHLRRNKKVQIEDSPSEYYSLDDDSTDSGE